MESMFLFGTRKEGGNEIGVGEEKKIQDDAVAIAINNGYPWTRV